MMDKDQTNYNVGILVKPLAAIGIDGKERERVSTRMHDQLYRKGKVPILQLL